MNWKNVLLIGVVVLLPLSISAQANILNAKMPTEIGKKTDAQIAKDNDAPLPYAYVDDRDILWSKTVWEIIDLDERINFPLYYPLDTIDIGPDRRSLYDVLIKNIKNGKLEDVYVDSYFTEKESSAIWLLLYKKWIPQIMGTSNIMQENQFLPNILIVGTLQLRIWKSTL